jgi:phosphate transport system permease protein
MTPPKERAHLSPEPDLTRLDKTLWTWSNLLNGLMTGLAGLCVALTLTPLGLLLGFVLVRGFERLNWQLLTALPPPPGFSEGGIANAIIGTVLVCAIATALSLPLGVLAAVYLSEFSRNNRLARWVRFATNVLSGVPSIIAGVFIYGLLVLTGLTGFSAVAGGVALAVLMLPTITRTADDALQRVPDDLRWASLGAGASDYQTVFRVVLPASAAAIATGATLAIARAAGETAPLIFTALFSPFWPESLFEPIATLSVLVYNFAIVPFKAQQALAWAGALVLMLLVVVTNLIAHQVTRAQKY